MTIQYHEEVVQGSDEWFDLRRGILTASETKMILTPTLKVADNDKTRTHLYELLAQRISGYVEPTYVSDDMMRGHEDEVLARIAYSEKYAPVHDMGFVTNDRFGFVLGCSPDGLVGEDGMIECKSRKQKYQVQTILSKDMPSDYMLQVQTALLVTERKWCDFITYSGGLPMFTHRIFPDYKIQEAIVQAATQFYAKMDEMQKEYEAILADPAMRLIPTERTIEEEIVV